MSDHNSTVWERVEEALVDLAIDKHNEEYPEIRLTVAIIVSGGRDRDEDYLKSDTFLYHCHLAGLSPEFVRAMFKKAFYHIDNKLPLAKKEESDPDSDEEYEAY